MGEGLYSIPFRTIREPVLFVLCLTSNPSSSRISNFQTLQSGQKLYQWVAQTAAGWGQGKKGEVGLVVGATQTQYIRDLRQLVPDTVFLVPGVGTQGGGFCGEFSRKAARRMNMES